MRLRARSASASTLFSGPFSVGQRRQRVKDRRPLPGGRPPKRRTPSWERTTILHPSPTTLFYLSRDLKDPLSAGPRARALRHHGASETPSDFGATLARSGPLRGAMPRESTKGGRARDVPRSGQPAAVLGACSYGTLGALERVELALLTFVLEPRALHHAAPRRYRSSSSRTSASVLSSIDARSSPGCSST